jgi:ADP-heptose:LPS heptosyltransferase
VNNCDYLARTRRTIKGFRNGLLHSLSWLIGLLRYSKRNRNIRPDDVKSILIIEIANVGDVIMTTPVVSALRHAFPSARITMLVSPVAKELVDDIVDETLLYCGTFNWFGTARNLSLRAQLRMFLELRTRNFDVIVDLRTHLMTLLLAAFGRAKYRVDFSTERLKPVIRKFWCVLTGETYRERFPRHEIDVKTGVLQRIGVTVTDNQPRIHLSSADRLMAQELFRKHRIENAARKIIVHPGTAWIYKQWRIDNYGRLIRSILTRFDAAVILTGSEGEKPLASQIIGAVNDRRVISCMGQTPLRQLAAVIEDSDLVICSDTMAAHLAGAVGTPVIVFFGPHDPRVFGPRGCNVRVIRKELPCSPCIKGFCSQPQGSRCMDLITVEDVMSAVTDMLDTRMPKTRTLCIAP